MQSCQRSDDSADDDDFNVILLLALEWAPVRTSSGQLTLFQFNFIRPRRRGVMAARGGGGGEHVLSAASFSLSGKRFACVCLCTTSRDCILVVHSRSRSDSVPLSRLKYAQMLERDCADKLSSGPVHRVRRLGERSPRNITTIQNITTASPASRRPPYDPLKYLPILILFTVEYVYVLRAFCTMWRPVGRAGCWVSTPTQFRPRLIRTADARRCRWSNCGRKYVRPIAESILMMMRSGHDDDDGALWQDHNINDVRQHPECKHETPVGGNLIAPSARKIEHG